MCRPSAAERAAKGTKRRRGEDDSSNDEDEDSDGPDRGAPRARRTSPVYCPHSLTHTLIHAGTLFPFALMSCACCHVRVCFSDARLMVRFTHGVATLRRAIDPAGPSLFDGGRPLYMVSHMSPIRSPRPVTQCVVHTFRVVGCFVHTGRKLRW